MLDVDITAFGEQNGNLSHFKPDNIKYGFLIKNLEI